MNTAGEIQRRADELFAAHQEQTWRTTDRFFVGLMLFQFVAGLLFALLVSPRTWTGTLSQVHIHVWTALFLGALIPSFPILLVWLRPGRFITRCTIAAAQMLMSALLIHLSGGRIETHFHIFGSLAFLAFYRDWRILIPATVVVGLDHAIRGYYWPESVYGVLTATVWRSVEHAAWVAFEDVVLVMGCMRGVRELRAMASAQAELEITNAAVESRIEERTRELGQRTAQLADVNAQIKAILDGAADAIVTIDRGGIILSFNRAAERMFGFTCDEVRGAKVNTLMPSPDRERHDEYLHRYHTTGTKRVIDQFREVVAQRKDGSTFPIELRVSQVEIEGKAIFTGIIRDITSRKEEELARRERERNTALVADIAVALNMGGALKPVLQKCMLAIVQRLDAAFARVWTINDNGDMLELQASSGIYTHIDGEHARIPVGKFKIGRIAEFRKPHLTNDFPNDPYVGDPDWARRENLVAFAGYPLIVDDILVGVVALFSRTPLGDNTLSALCAAADNIASGIGRKRAEERLAQAQLQLLNASRMAGMAEIATGVLHNVGNALNSVNVSTSVVKERVKELKVSNIGKVAELIMENSTNLEHFFHDEDRGKRLPSYLHKLAQHMVGEQEAILSEIASLTERVDHIKSIVTTQQSYAQAGGVIEELSLSHVLEQSLQMHIAGFQRHGIVVEKEFQAVPSIMADKHKLVQILLNLLSNARQALSEPTVANRTLTLRIGMRGAKMVFIEVCDTGVGIADEILTRIFTYGFTTKKEGHGFGLHSCANAAKEMGGSLTVRSDGAGRGATFTLELPLRAERTPT